MYLDIFTHREEENKMGKELLLLLCFWHSLTAFGQQRLHQNQGMLEGAVSDYTQLGRDPKPYGIQVKSLAVLKNLKLECKEPKEASLLRCGGTLPIALGEEVLECEGIAAAHK